MRTITASFLSTPLLFAAAGPIKPSQDIPNLSKNRFEGRPWTARPLRPKTRYAPDSLALHRDSGNTRADDWPGPLGHNFTLFTTDSIAAAPIFFAPNGQATAGATCGENSTTCVVSMDPETFDVLDEWLAPSNVLFNTLTYMTQTAERVFLPGNGSLYELARERDDMRLRREFNGTELLGSEGGLGSFMEDGEGNIWFANGALQGAGFGQGLTEALIGFIRPSDGRHFSVRLEDEVIENSLAISESMVYMVTGPAGKADVANATGKFYALRAGDEEVEVVYRAEYDAGSGLKLGGLSRGSGSSPNLLGNDYVAITDNADGQINLLIYPQVPPGGQHPAHKNSHVQPVCSVPLFTPGESSLDSTFVNHFNGKSYGVVVTNCYSFPFPLWFANAGLDINGNWSSHAAIGAGLQRIDVTPQPDGTVTCGMRWTDDTSRTTSIATLSTANGLLYNYDQDLDLAREQGLFVWYLTARDWESGEMVWRYRVGEGGVFNNNYQTPTLGPGGCLHLYVVGGLVRLCDG